MRQTDDQTERYVETETELEETETELKIKKNTRKESVIETGKDIERDANFRDRIGFRGRQRCRKGDRRADVGSNIERQQL